ncbi:MAG: energy-coupling factor transporter ATPase [Erysipelotrichaceae bacterium]|jgi:energy-coupling factor transport system ATP-binding protein|nr:energy-coupling factor transporter ATPase [Erysipelotrichaceae bacterium]MCB9500098.1 energy-coupling factor transporter ATPase [Erysipelotrichaceae bacterium]
MDSLKAIEVKNLCFNYEKDVPIIKNVSFSVNKGEYVSLIGHNGSGKSTLAKLIAYLDEATSGEIYIDGLKAEDKNASAIRERIGIVFQNPDNQFIGSTVEDDIAFGLENRNIERSQMVKLVKEYASEVGMEDYMNKEPQELSGGQKQRVAIAGILSLGLNIVILDEATSMLDPEGVEDINNLIMDMKAENHDLTIISITHDMEEAYLSDRVIVLNKGEIVEDGTPTDVFADEKKLHDIGLGIPFVLNVKNKLNEKGIKVPDDIKTIKGLSEFLCK